MVRSLFFFLRRGEKNIHSIFFLKLFKENNFYKWKLRWSILKSTRASLPNIMLCFGSATEYRYYHRFSNKSACFLRVLMEFLKPVSS